MGGISEKSLEQGGSMGPGDGSEWVEETECSCVDGTECAFFLLLLFSFFFILFYMHLIGRELSCKNTKLF